MSFPARLFLTLLLLFFPLTLMAAEQTPPEKNFRAYTSSITCEQAVANLDKKPAQSNFALMISAFITGTNYIKGRDSQIDLKGMMMITEQYCRNNPKQPVTNALVALDKAIDQRLIVQKKEEAAKPAAPPTVKPK